jgi:hypothetical protein
MGFSITRLIEAAIRVGASLDREAQANRRAALARAEAGRASGCGNERDARADDRPVGSATAQWSATGYSATMTGLSDRSKCLGLL